MKGLILTYVLTYGGAVASLFKPYYGLLIYICFAIIQPPRLFFWSVPPGNYSRTVAIALLVGWAIHGFGSWNFGRGRAPIAALVAFWAWCLISAMQFRTDTDAWECIDNLTKIVLPIVVAMTLIETPEQLRMLGLVVGASIGYVAMNENQTYYTWGIYLGDNLLAHSFSLGVGVTFFAGLLLRSWWLRLGAFAASAMAVNAVFFHMSRGAMIGICVTGLLTFVVLPKKPLYLMLIAVAVAVAASLAGPQVVEEFQTVFAEEEERDESAGSRLEFWQAMARATQDNPVLGVGPRRWPKVGHEYGAEPGREGHGAWQQLYAETGIPGGTFILLFYGLIVWRLFPIAIGRKHQELAWARTPAQLALVGIPAWVIQQIVGSFYLVELPYYVGLIGAATLKLTSTVPHIEPGAAVGHSGGLTVDAVSANTVSVEPLASERPGSAR